MMAGKTVLITGAGSGIGRAMALRAAQLGLDVLIAGRREDALLETVAKGPTSAVRHVVADVTRAADRARLVEAVGGRLDYLVNNAGVLRVGHFCDMEDEALYQMAQTNLVAPMALTRDLLAALKQDRGRVVNIGSVFGDIGYPFFAGYSATKFGLRGFSDALRRELSGSGIGVTYIAPRATHTAAEDAFSALIEPLQMTVDSAEAVAEQAWSAILKGKRESFPRGKERFFVRVQRIFPALVDKSVGAQARDPRTRAALDMPAQSQH